MVLPQAVYLVLIKTQSASVLLDWVQVRSLAVVKLCRMGGCVADFLRGVWRGI